MILSGIPISSTSAMRVRRSGSYAISIESASEMVWNTVRNSWKPPGRRSRTRRSRLIFANDRSRACRVILIMHERLDVQPRQLVAALEEIELNDELEADDFAAELADQLRHRRRSPASGEHVIDDQDATADFD